MMRSTFLQSTVSLESLEVSPLVLPLNRASTRSLALVAVLFIVETLNSWVSRPWQLFTPSFTRDSSRHCLPSFCIRLSGCAFPRKTRSTDLMLSSTRRPRTICKTAQETFSAPSMTATAPPCCATWTTTITRKLNFHCIYDAVTSRYVLGLLANSSSRFAHLCRNL